MRAPTTRPTPEAAARRAEFEQITAEAAAQIDRAMAEAADAGVDPFDESGDDDDAADRAAVPAYAAAIDLAHRVIDVLRDRDESHGRTAVPPHGESDDELIGRAMIGIQIAVAKLIGGHGMGYDDGVLCANIVKCKRALADAADGQAAWAEVRARGLIPADVAGEIITAHATVVGLIERRIADLRSRVWW